MRIAFTGASGAGKTTMVHYVRDTYSIPWIDGSSGIIKTQQDQLDIQGMGLKLGKGHAEVIKSGHMFPDAAWVNQRRILDRRADLFNYNDSFVTDRSPIDCIVYAIMQCGPYVKQEDLKELIDKATRVLKRLDYLIYVRPLSFVQDNGSRIANLYYQMAVDAVFYRVLDQIYELNPGQVPVLITLENSGIEARQKKIASYIQGA